MNSNYISQCKSCDSPISLDTIEDLQTSISKTMAKRVNRKYSAEKNDLGVYVSNESIQKLEWYQNILTQITYCNVCFEDFEIEDIVSLIKNQIIVSKNGY